MTDHLKDSETWLKHAKEEKQNHRVAAAMAVHSTIKTLNALFEEFLGEMPGRHDHATDYFKRLIDEGHLEPEESKYTNKIQSTRNSSSFCVYRKSPIFEHAPEKGRCRLQSKILQQKRQRQNG